MSPIGQGLVRWEPEWIEALVRAGRRDEALAAIAEFEAVVPADQWARQRARPPEGDARRRRRDRRRALRGDRRRRLAAAGNHVGEGRTEILWGERLRRSRRRGEARVHLERAVELLRGIGATVLAERATTELRAAGGVVGEDVASHQLLTPHELQVARLVVGGASNRDLAAKLFISPRTVEAHLTAIFRKLAVRNRRELAARALDDPVLQP